MDKAGRAILPPSARQLEQKYYEKLRNAEEQEMFLAGIDHEANYRRQLGEDSEHLNRIQLLRKERDLLQRESEYKRSVVQIPYTLKYNQEQNFDDEQLIKRYEDGSKAKEYYHDIHNQNYRKNEEAELLRLQRERRQRQRESKQLKQKLQKRFANQKVNREGETHQKAYANYTERKDNYSNNKKDVYETPYDIIRQYPKTAKKEEIKRSSLAQQLEKEFDKIEVKEHQQSAVRFTNTMKQKDSSPLRLLQESNKVPKATSPLKNMNKYQSMGKFAPYRSKSTFSPMKKSYDNSYLQSRRLKNEQPHQPKPSMKEIELNALKKIENRLKVSKVMYEDSQFRNIKYEEKHLFNTFQIECKQRREMKDKMNNHPMVLKKHALVC